MGHWLWLIIASFLLLASAAASPAGNSRNGPVSHGTINIVLANANGLVVLTDSMVTSGSRQLPEPAQKLFRLDDETVCTIAGFLWAAAPVNQMDTSTSAIVREYERQLVGKGQRTIAEKLTDLEFLFNLHLSSIANIRTASGKVFVPPEYLSQIIIAGYDTDGSPKIGRIRFVTTPVDGRFDSSTQDIEITDVEKKLVFKIGGMSDVAEGLLLGARSAIEGPIQGPMLADYAASLQKDDGQSFTIEQMKSLAMELALETAKHYPAVGGTNQIAVLQGGRIVGFDQQHFPDPPNTNLYFMLLEGVGFHGESAFRPGPTNLCVKCDIAQMRWKLDGNYFVTTTFTDSVLTYDGGPTYFSKTNQVIRCVLVIGPHAKLHSPVLRQLEGFPWLRIEYPGRKSRPDRSGS